MCGVFGVVLPGGEPTEAAAIATLGLFALQHRGQESAGIAVSDGEQLMLYKDLGMIGIGPRRAPPAEPARHAGHRPLPLLDDRVDDLGERPADVSPGTAPRDRDRPQRQPREHARAARPAARRPLAPARLDRHGAADGAPRRRAGRGHGPGARARCCRASAARSASSSSISSGSSACATRTGSGRSSSAGCPAEPDARRPERWRPVDGRRGRRAGASRPRRPASTSSAPSSSATSSPARSSSSSRAGRPGRSATPRPNPALCVFELIYFARPDSYMEGRNLYEARRRMGEQLALEHPVDADLVIPVPDTGAPAAAGLRRGERACRIARGCIATATPGGPSSSRRRGMRHRGVTIKLNPLREVVAGKRLIVVDDSIVRGTTTKRIVELLRQGRRRARSTSGSAPRRSTTRASTASTRRSRPS